MTTPFEFPGQPILPNEVVQGTWFNILTHIMVARTLADVRANYHQALGYITALGDTNAIDAMGVKQMSTTALRALNEALEAQHRDEDGKRP
ncbi:hypothetical protein P3S72_09340 [Pseudomonas sp. D3]|uniref:hypothetical protein n=1 Tax=Pseudomonas sp. D3 TaxID=517398 RepID=UPI0023E3E1D4|nr:hypothetical protein [Pseudomonas sp. D3]WET12314.1 hypothetical protein P3S72_09340 [Pseudomonas sp. D3]